MMVIHLEVMDSFQSSMQKLVSARWSQLLNRTDEFDFRKNEIVVKCYKYFTSSPNSNILVLLEEISWRKKEKKKQKRKFYGNFYFNFIFKCIYFWWRLCDRHVNEEKNS